MTELISVITTAYNAEKYIKETIESILNQDYSNLELIIVDDGSDDKTVGRIREFSDPRIRLIKKGRIGRGKALNTAVKESRGEYIAVQDADDISHPKRLSTEIRYLKKINNQGLIGSSQVEFYDDQVPEWATDIDDSVKDGLLTDCKDGLLYFNPVSHTSMMIPKKILKAVGSYDQTRKNLYDWDLYLRVLAEGYGVYVVSLPLVGKRLHQDQFFERKDRLSYLYGSLKLQIRAAVLLKRYGLSFISIPFLFLYRLLPLKLRIGTRPFIKALFGK